MDNTKNPEALHNIADNLSGKQPGAWVNPGTPDSPLAEQEQMAKAEISPAATAKLRSVTNWDGSAPAGGPANAMRP